MTSQKRNAKQRAKLWDKNDIRCKKHRRNAGGRSDSLIREFLKALWLIRHPHSEFDRSKPELLRRVGMTPEECNAKKWDAGDIRCKNMGNLKPNTSKTGSPASRKRREKLWDESDVRCKYHPERRCNRNVFVSGRKKRCASCASRKADGSRRPAYQRMQQRVDIRRMMEGRRANGRHGPSHGRVSMLGRGNQLTVLEYFNKVTGFNFKGDSYR